MDMHIKTQKRGEKEPEQEEAEQKGRERRGPLYVCSATSFWGKRSRAFAASMIPIVRALWGRKKKKDTSIDCSRWILCDKRTPAAQNSIQPNTLDRDTN